MKITLGTKLWWNSYCGTRSGTVIAFRERSGFTEDEFVVDTGQEFFVLTENDHTFETRSEAILESARKKQQEASRLLTESASMFENAGVAMKEEQVTQEKVEP